MNYLPKVATSARKLIGQDRRLPLTFKMSSSSLVKREHRTKPAACNLAMNEQITALRESGADICHLAFGQSPFSIPPGLVKALADNAHRKEYLPVAGLPALREELARFHSVHDGVDVSPDQIVVGPGSKELIFLAMMLFDGGVILVSPSWTTYAPQARMAGSDTLVAHTRFEDGWRLTPELLGETVAGGSRGKKWLLVLNNPNNPSGVSYSKSELEALRDACRQLDVTVLCDEIYGRLSFGGDHVCGLGVFGSGCVVTSGFSKWASAGGWRVGYAVVPEAHADLRAALVSAASHSYSCAPAPVQVACAQFLAIGDAETDRYIKCTCIVLKAVAQLFTSELQSVGVKVHPSAGGYYLFPDFGVCKAGLGRLGVTTCQQFCEFLLEEAKVAVLQGSAHLRPDSEWTVRLCYVDFDGDRFLSHLGFDSGLANGAAGDRDAAGTAVTPGDIRRMAPDMCRGLERLKSFVVKYSK